MPTSLLSLSLCSVFSLCTTLPHSVVAHSRLSCPSARNPNTNIKSGPCGDDTDLDGSSYFADNAAGLVLSPGPFTITWQESIAHNGAPWRVTLSGDGSDAAAEACVLLDHIPHFSGSNPTYTDEETWTEYSLTIEIPDVACEKCSIHLANPMTDKIGDAKYADGDGCCDPGTAQVCTATSTPEQCSSVYHSCSVPFRINGTTPRSQYTCPQAQPSDWPTQWAGTSSSGDAVAVDVTEMGVYRQETGNWEDGQLQDVPARYRAGAGYCAPPQDNQPNTAGTTVLSAVGVMLTTFALLN